jgi:site-specific recombinase XerD
LPQGIDAGCAFPHVLKHSLGYAMVKANANIMVIKQALGHKSVSSTAVYTGVTDRDASAAIKSALMEVF